MGEALTISFIGFAAILVLGFLRFPLALSMGLVGVIGFGELANYRAAISNIGRLVMDLGQSYSLSILPLFWDLMKLWILMIYNLSLYLIN